MPALLAEDLLNEMIPPLKGTDSVGKAARWLDEFHVAQLPVLDNRHYRGLVTEADLADFDNPEALLSELPLGYADAYVRPDQHFYRVMELAIENKIQLVPVVDERQEYAGVVTIADALAAFGQQPAGVLLPLVDHGHELNLVFDGQLHDAVEMLVGAHEGIGEA